MLEDIETAPPEPEEAEQEPDVLEIPDEGASGRLAMLRRELDGDPMRRDHRWKSACHDSSTIEEGS